MGKQIKIQIPIPCHEDWEAMDVKPEGRFCSSCKKTVIDFTSMTDGQLVAYFKVHPFNSCGRFHEDQLDKKLEIPVRKIPWLKYFFQITLPALLVTHRVGAQKLAKKFVSPVVMTESAAVSDSSFTLSGRVVDKTGNGIAFASVTIEGISEGMAADSNGVFSMKVPGCVKSIFISAVGYEKKQVFVTDMVDQVIPNIMLSENNLLAPVVIFDSNRRRMGSYYTGSSRIITTGYTKTFPSFFSTGRNSVQIFPNPAKRNGNIIIRWANPVTGNQTVFLYNSSGALVFTDAINNVAKSLTEANLQLSLNTGGYYILKVQDSKTRKIQSVQLIIE